MLAGVDGDLLISSKLDREVDVVGPVRPNTSWQAKIPGGYDNSQFIIDWDAHTVTCPQGQTACNFRSLCTRSKTDPRFIRDSPQAEHQAIQSIRQEQHTD